MSVAARRSFVNMNDYAGFLHILAARTATLGSRCNR
jgi:hypothetical protein